MSAMREEQHHAGVCMNLPLTSHIPGADLWCEAPGQDHAGGDRTAAARGLQRVLRQPATGILRKLPGDVGDAVIQVQVAPLQPPRLAAPQAPHPDQGAHPMTAWTSDELGTIADAAELQIDRGTGRAY
jgi:hypothetical protein